MNFQNCGKAGVVTAHRGVGSGARESGNRKEQICEGFEVSIMDFIQEI